MISRMIYPTHPHIYIWIKIHPIAMRRFLACEDHKVNIGPNYLHTVTKILQKNVWCSIQDFEKAYPKDWQEIQVELALLKLKSS